MAKFKTNDRSKVRYPKKIGSLVNQLVARRGYLRVQTNERIYELITQAVGKELSRSVVSGNLRRGILDIYAADSVTLQELTFLKSRILKKVAAGMPGSQIKGIRFRIRS